MTRSRLEIQMRHRRLLLCLWLALSASAVTWYFWSVQSGDQRSDFYQLWGSARTAIAGGSPYAAVGPGRAYEWPVPLAYPPSAIAAAMPLSLVPLRLADVLFVGLSSFALAWALTKRRVDNPQLLVFASASFLFALQTSQWSPVLIAAALLTPLAPLLTCKPTIAAALFVAFPRARTVVVAAIAGAIALVALPSSWWRHWRRVGLRVE